MNRKSTSTFAAPVTSLRTAMVFVAGVAGILHGQSSITVSHSGSADESISMHTLMATFVTSDAATAQEAVKSAAVSAAEGKVISAVAMRSLPIPVVGALPVDGVMKAFGKFRKTTVKGFDFTFLQGVSSETAVRSGDAAFTISVPGQVETPTLVRLRPSAKDSARIVESAHVTYKMTGSSINPATKETLGTERDAIDCAVETRDGAIVLTPRSTLPPGEYAIVAASPHGGATWAWDFRVVQ